MQPQQIQIGGQTAWAHDANAAGGVFHTFDGLQVAGPKDMPRKLHVWLPPGYGENGRRHPLVVMNDGHAVFFDGGQPGGIPWNAQHAAADLLARGEIPAPIIAAVCPLNREYEYLHLHGEFFGFKIPGLGGGGVRAYSSYLAEHVVPFLDQYYLTIAARKARVIAGSSHGGLAAFYTATMLPDVFGAAICMSPSFWANHKGSIENSALMDAARDTLQDRQRRPRLWIDWGLVRSGGFHNLAFEAWATWRASDMVEVLKTTYEYEAGRELFWVEDADGSHTEGSWARRLPSALSAVLREGG